MPRGTKQSQSATERAVLARIRAAMKEQGVSMRALAPAVGISSGQLSDVLNGHKPTTFTEMVEMCSALGLDLAVIIARIEDGSRG